MKDTTILWFKILHWKQARWYNFSCSETDFQSSMQCNKYTRIFSISVLYGVNVSVCVIKLQTSGKNKWGNLQRELWSESLSPQRKVWRWLDYFFQKLPQLLGPGITWTHRLLGRHHCADTSALAVLGWAVHLPGLLWISWQHLVASGTEKEGTWERMVVPGDGGKAWRAKRIAKMRGKKNDKQTNRQMQNVRERMSDEGTKKRQTIII